MALKSTDPMGLEDKPSPVTIDEVTVEGSPAPVELTDEQLAENSNMEDAFRALEAGDKELAGRILFGPSESGWVDREHDMAAAFVNGGLSIATFDWAREKRLNDKPMLGGSAEDVEFGSMLGLYALQSVGDTLALSASGRLALDSPAMLRGGAGDKYAGQVLEGGTGRAFAGHGEYRFGSGTATIPEGTTLTTWTSHGRPIPEKMGLLIEAGEYELVGKLFAAEAEGATSWLPGAGVPNYTLKAPTGLTIGSRSMTVENATPLSNLLRPGMGHIDWAACQLCR